MNNNYEDYFDDGTEKHQAQKLHQQAIPKKNKNALVIILLSCVLIVGIAVLGIQLSVMFGKIPQNNQNLQKGGVQTEKNFTSGETYTNGNFPDEGTDTQQFGTPDDGPTLIGPGSGNGPGVSDNNQRGAILSRRDGSGKVEYSTDDGKTWSQTAPGN